MEILKVSSKSNPSKVAGAIANIYREKGYVEMQTIGAGSLNQAIKAIAIARGFVAPTGDNLVVIPAYIAKGLEFDSVIVYTDKDNKFTEKEKYLFYVACTRCQHQLIVYNQ